MDGVQIGEDFVSSQEVKDGIIDFIRRIAGPLKDPVTGKRETPDILFVINVMKKTIPMDVLIGEKRKDYERALKTLFDMRDELSRIETKLGIFWPIEDESEIEKEDE